MKKHIYLIAMASLFLFSAAQLNAQNQYVLQNDNGMRRTLTFPDNVTVTQHSDHVISWLDAIEAQPQEKNDTVTYYHFHVYPPPQQPGLFHRGVALSDGTNMIGRSHWNDEYLEAWVPTGTYHLASLAECAYFYYPEVGECVRLWILDDFELTSDTTIYFDFDDCVYQVGMIAEDENGNPLNANMLYYNYKLLIQWHHSGNVGIDVSGCDIFPERMPLFMCNQFNEGNYMQLDAYLEPGDQKSYMLTSPIVKGMEGDRIFTVTADELSVVQEKFTMMNDTAQLFYSLNTRFVREAGDWYIHEFSPYFVFDPEQPYTIVSNARLEDPLDFEVGCKTILWPTVYENDSYDPYLVNVYRPAISTPFYFNADGDVVREAMPFFRWGPECASWTNCFPETPARKIDPVGKIISVGERTPLAFYCPKAFKKGESPLPWQDFHYFSRGLFFSGEYGSERSCDYDQYIKVVVDDEVVFNDSLYLFNALFNSYFPSDEVPVEVGIYNDHLFANGVPKSNFTRVQFDFRRDEVIPPTMTFFRVLDGNGDENVWQGDLTQSTLVFGCADYTYSDSIWVHAEYSDNPQQSHLVYIARPNIEVYYSVGNDVWLPLVITENESLFHINYGNVFVADLSQLEGRALEKWVSLKFMLEDEAGNTQEQTLENVFYAGQTISVDEYAAERLEHEVIPNPFTDEVRIKSAQPLDGVARVQLYDVLGRMAYDATENGHAVNEFIIDGSALKPGIYFYSINTENGLMQGRIVKE